MNPQQAYEFGLLPLVGWREGQNQGYAGMLAVLWSIKNRMLHPTWWGNDYPSVILKHWQYSSFNWGDPNSQKDPTPNSPAWADALRAAWDVFTGAVPDPTGGADSYYDRSLDVAPSSPPTWAKTATHTADIGAFHFFKTR